MILLKRYFDIRLHFIGRLHAVYGRFRFRVKEGIVMDSVGYCGKAHSFASSRLFAQLRLASMQCRLPL